MITFPRNRKAVQTGPRPCTWYIHNDNASGQRFGIDGVTGDVIFQSASLAEVIQAVLDETPMDGHVIAGGDPGYDLGGLPIVFKGKAGPSGGTGFQEAIIDFSEVELTSLGGPNNDGLIFESCLASTFKFGPVTTGPGPGPGPGYYPIRFRPTVNMQYTATAGIQYSKFFFNVGAGMCVDTAYATFAYNLVDILRQTSPVTIPNGNYESYGNEWRLRSVGHTQDVPFLQEGGPGGAGLHHHNHYCIVASVATGKTLVSTYGAYNRYDLMFATPIDPGKGIRFEASSHDCIVIGPGDVGPSLTHLGINNRHL